MCDGLHYPSLGPRGVLACQRWNAPAHLTQAERKQIPLALDKEIVPYRSDYTKSRELRLWFEHLILQFVRDCHNTRLSSWGNTNEKDFLPFSLSAWATVRQTKNLFQPFADWVISFVTRCDVSRSWWGLLLIVNVSVFQRCRHNENIYEGLSGLCDVSCCH